MERAQLLLLSKPGVIVAFAAALLLLEWFFPAVRPLAKAQLDSARAWLVRWAKNVAMVIINAALSPLIVIPLSALAAQWAAPWRPEWWSGGAGLALDLLLLDFWIYWWHRANHELPFLWRFHEVHHLDEFLDATTAVRFHFGEVVISSLVRAAVIFALAVPLSSVLIFETLVFLSALFHHSNIRLKPSFERAVSRLIVTPSIHWVHHHAVKSDTDSNYATVLSAWDLLFRTRSPTKRSAAMEIGVERRRDNSLAALLLRPFRARPN